MPFVSPPASFSCSFWVMAAAISRCVAKQGLTSCAHTAHPQSDLLFLTSTSSTVIFKLSPRLTRRPVITASTRVHWRPWRCQYPYLVTHKPRYRLTFKRVVVTNGRSVTLPGRPTSIPCRHQHCCFETKHSDGLIASVPPPAEPRYLKKP